MKLFFSLHAENSVLLSLCAKNFPLSRPMGRVINIYTSLTHHESAVRITETLQAIIMHHALHTAWNISAAEGKSPLILREA